MVDYEPLVSYKIAFPMEWPKRKLDFRRLRMEAKTVVQVICAKV
jgi:hypothetical protein